MGVDVEVAIIYGVPEPQSLKDKTITTAVLYKACSEEGADHFSELEDSCTWNCCPQCGASLRVVEKFIEEAAAWWDFYSPKGLTEEEVEDWIEDSFIVETDYICGGQLFFGFVVESIDPNQGERAMVPTEISPGDVRELQAFLDSLGIDEKPRLWVVPIIS